MWTTTGLREARAISICSTNARALRVARRSGRGRSRARTRRRRRRAGRRAAARARPTTASKCSGVVRMQSDDRVDVVAAAGELDRLPRRSQVDADGQHRVDAGRARASATAAPGLGEHLEVAVRVDEAHCSALLPGARGRHRAAPQAPASMRGKSGGATTTAAGSRRPQVARSSSRSPGAAGLAEAAQDLDGGAPGSPGRGRARRGAGRPPGRAARRRGGRPAPRPWRASTAPLLRRSRLRRRTYSQTVSTAAVTSLAPKRAAGGAHHRLALGRHRGQRLASGRRRDDAVAVLADHGHGAADEVAELVGQLVVVAALEALEAR